jgi:hypothetical protein
LVLTQHMDNLSFASNNNDIQSFVHGGDVEAETMFHNKEPMEIEGEGNQRFDEEQGDHNNVQ